MRNAGYSYSYSSQGRQTVPSGYYAYPSGGGYYYQSFAPSTGRPAAAAPPPSRPAPVASAPAPAVSAREAALEARVRRLESVIDGLNQGAVRMIAPSSNSRYYSGGNTNIERDSRYPNWSFDHSQWLGPNL